MAFVLREITTRHGFEEFKRIVSGESHHDDYYGDNGDYYGDHGDYYGDHGGVEYHHGDVHIEGNVVIDGDLYVHGYIHEERYGEYQDDHWEEDTTGGKGHLVEDALFEVQNAQGSLDHANNLLHERISRREDNYPAFLAVNKPNKALANLI